MIFVIYNSILSIYLTQLLWRIKTDMYGIVLYTDPPYE